MKSINFKKLFFAYLTFLFLVAVYYLYGKHTGGLDSTISEWLINYQGGFTRRGLPGEIFFYISNLFEIEIRFSIFIFQIIIYFCFLCLVFYFFKDLKINFFYILVIFSPIFLLYHVAELEILARKELLVFIQYLFFLILLGNKNFSKFKYVYIFFTLPLIALSWEPVIFFIFFYIFLLLITEQNQKFSKKYKKILLALIPFSLTILAILFNNYDALDEKKMCDALMVTFGEHCYMSLRYLDTTVGQNFYSLIKDVKASHIIRYLLILIIGFAPLFILIYYSSYNKIFKSLNIFRNKSLFIIYLFIISPVLILFLMGLDWGRWVNILYFFSLSTFFFLIQNKIYIIYFKKLEEIRINLRLKNRFVSILVILLFCFGWNPKTLFKGDVASFPGYRVPYKLIKYISTQ